MYALQEDLRLTPEQYQVCSAETPASDAVTGDLLQDLAEKIEQLNAAIDEVSSRIGQDGTEVEEAAGVAA